MKNDRLCVRNYKKFACGAKTQVKYSNHVIFPTFIVCKNRAEGAKIFGGKKKGRIRQILKKNTRHYPRMTDRGTNLASKVKAGKRGAPNATGRKPATETHPMLINDLYILIYYKQINWYYKFCQT